MTKVIVHVDDEQVEINRVRLDLRVDIEKGEIKLYSFLNPIQAFDFIQQEHVDLVITDFQMYPWNGRELSEKIKAIKPELKILLRSYSNNNYDPSVMDGVSNKDAYSDDPLVAREIDGVLYTRQ